MSPGDQATPRVAPRLALAPDGAARTVTGEGGRVWSVREDRPPAERWGAAEIDAVVHGDGVGALVFDSPAEACTTGVTRVRQRLYPARWDRLPDAALEQLRARGCPVR
jgi:hypothetical protein